MNNVLLFKNTNRLIFFFFFFFIKADSVQDTSSREIGPSVVLRIQEDFTHLTFPIEERISYYRLFTQKNSSNAFAASGITTHNTKRDPQISTNWMLPPHAQEIDLFWLKPDQPSLHNKTVTIQYFNSHPASP